MTKLMKALLVLALALATTATVQAATARLQVIHNAADPAAATVDIYVNDDLTLDDFSFREATPFIEVPAGVELNIGVAPGNSGSAGDVIATFPVTLAAGQTYVAIANGVLDPGAFAANPEGRSIAFSIFPRDDMRTRSGISWLVQAAIFHGATDAPAVDIVIDGKWGNWNLADNLSYGEFTRYRYLVPKSYKLDVTPANDNSAVVASFEADLSSLRGGAAVVFASGFLNPAANSGGAGFGLFAALPDGRVIELPRLDTPGGGMARLQVIHNAADPAAAVVDVYVNGTLTLDDFAFRAATPFIDVPAGVELNIAVAPGNSSSVDDALATFPVTLEAGQTYVAVANGVLDAGGFAANPDGRSIGFSIFPRDKVRESARFGFLVDLLAFHGATDAPQVDILVKTKWWKWRLFDGLGYGDFSATKSTIPARFELQVTPAGDNRTVVAAFDADLRGLRGQSAVVFASGFLNPPTNQNGPAFGLFAALADGTVIEIPRIVDEQFARLQIIHNAADPAAASVDIWVNDTKAVPDFAFRTATPFIDIPAGVDLNIGIAPAGSMSSGDAIRNLTVNFEPNKKYIAIANGVLDPGAFAPNPEGRPTAFTLFVKEDAREAGANGWSAVDLFALHGASDAPAVDVIARGVATLVDNAAYGDLTDYFSVPPASYVLDVTPANDNGTIVASFEADLSGLNGGAAAVFASGFLNPADNQNGAAFGLFAALPNGTVVELPALDPVARLQVIHNAADPAAASVDVWVNGTKAIPNFEFRSATPYLDLPAGTELNIGIAPAGSSMQSESIASFAVTLDAGKSYVAMANGVLNPGSFAPNPEGNPVAFTLFTRADAREASLGGSDEVDFFVVHGSTDAPAVDVIARGVATLVDNAAYGDITPYLSVPAGSYTLDITPAEDNSTIVASFEADLSTLGGGAAVVFASGFLTPDDNQDGDAFGLFAALPDGTVIGLPAAVSSQNPVAGMAAKVPMTFALNQNYPNPFNPTTTISFALPSSGEVRLSVFNVLGQEIATLVNRTLEAGEHAVEFDAGGIASGVYFYRIETESNVETRKMMLLK